MTIYISRDPESISTSTTEIYFWAREPHLSKHDGWILHGGAPLGELPVSAFTNPIAPGTCEAIKGVAVELLEGE
jgi:hypothetical protein